MSQPPIRLAINGFGRIGRLVLRALLERDWCRCDAINATATPAQVAHLLNYDSVHGRYHRQAGHDEAALLVDQTVIPLFRERQIADIRWPSIDIVLECTGQFNKRDLAGQHLQSGAQAVLVSAPVQAADATVVFGVNHHDLTEKDRVVSNGSCTTNCLAVVAKVLLATVGIEKGYMTTIHAYTGDQALVDRRHNDWCRGRAAAMSLVPTKTGAAKALATVMPELAGKLDGVAIRAPTANVSLIDLSFVSQRPTSVNEINQSFIDASQTLSSVLAVNDQPLVSIDFNHRPESAIVDLSQTAVIEGTFCRVCAWYDNEWAYALRMLDVAKQMAQTLF